MAFMHEIKWNFVFQVSQGRVALRLRSDGKYYMPYYMLEITPVSLILATAKEFCKLVKIVDKVTVARFWYSVETFLAIPRCDTVYISEKNNNIK